MKNKIWRRWVCHKRNIRLIWKDLITGNGLHPFKWMHSFHTRQEVCNIIYNTKTHVHHYSTECWHDYDETVLRDWTVITEKCTICGKENVYWIPQHGTVKENIASLL